MNTIKEKIKNFFSKIKTFVSDNKKIVILISSVIVVILLLLIFLLIALSKNNKPETARGRVKPTIQTNNSDTITVNKKVNPNDLWLLDEPIQLPPIQFSREQRQIWKPAEVDYWYEAPSEEAMKILREKNKKIINDLLEEAP